MIPCVRGIISQHNKIALIERYKNGVRYFTLPGGHIEAGETPEVALHREIQEELSVRVTAARHVCTEPANKHFGVQYIFLCTVSGTHISLSAEADESMHNLIGTNTYTPGWYDWEDIERLPLQSPALKAALLRFYRQGWPDHVVELTS